MDTGDYCQPPFIAATKLATSKDALDYNMCHEGRGICLIIENVKFSSRRDYTRHLTRRVGSEVDSEQLVDVFSKLEFTVVLQKDLHLKQIVEILRQVSALDHTNHDCFVCIVLTHGEHGQLFSYDNRYSIDTLFKPFLGDTCPSLVGKPKLFFIQACQGSRLDDGVVIAERQDALDSTSSYFRIPTYADFMVAYSTLPGFYSFRNTEKGSWFIRALVEVLHEFHSKYDLLTMMTIVCQRVAYNFTSNAAMPALSGKKQVPCITSMLTRRIFFPRKTFTI